MQKDHLIARPEGGGTRYLDDTTALHADGGVRQIRFESINTLDKVDVSGVDGGSEHPYLNFTGFGFTNRDGLQLKDLFWLATPGKGGKGVLDHLVDSALVMVVLDTLSQDAGGEKELVPAGLQRNALTTLSSTSLAFLYQAIKHRASEQAHATGVLDRAWCNRKSTSAVIMAHRPNQSPALPMTRGIHLKQITNTDLGLLGLPDDLMGAEVAFVDHRQLAEERDPSLARIIQEVIATLEETLDLLDRALAFDQESTPSRVPSQNPSVRPRV